MSMKRLFDTSVSLIGIVLTAPLMIVLAIMIKLESLGPVYYRCPRVGEHGRLFKMLKFRTMVESADKIDCKLCGESDVRVTPFGKFLRRTKLNELPQLFNVLWGDMSLVGPRPEDPKFITFYPDKWKIVLSVKPGIIGPNQILHRNEEDLFPPDCNPESFYVENILPEKLERDIAFIQNQSLPADLSLLLRGVYVTLFKGRLRSRFSAGKVRYLELLRDLGLSVLAYLLASAIRFANEEFPEELAINAGLILAVNACLFPFSGLYKRTSRFFSLPDLIFLFKLVMVAGVLFIVANRLVLPEDYHSRVVFSMYPVFLVVAIAGARVVHRMYLERSEQKRQEESPKCNTIIYGAGRLGADTIRSVQFEPDSKLLGLVDDDPSLKNRSILGFKVLGGGHDLAFLKELYHVDRVIISIRTRAIGDAEAAQRHCMEAGISEVITASAKTGTSRAPALIGSVKPKLRFSDRLGMKQVLLEPVDDLTGGSAVAIIGGGDDLGEHLCREAARLGAKRVFVIDNCSARLARIRDNFGHHPLRTAEIVTVYQPWGFHAETLDILQAHNVKWIFCNHLNRPGVSSALNGSAFVLADLIETARLVNIASNLPCKGFTLISPVLVDGYSEQEKSVHLLCEEYLATVARRKSNGTRYGVVRIPNLLEDENGIFKRTARNLASGSSAPVPKSPMRFSSARYTARSILNCLPFHNGGETYVQSAGLTVSLETLIDFDSRKEAQDGNKWYSDRPDVEMICVKPTAKTNGSSKTAMTSTEHSPLAMNPELHDGVNYRQVIANFAYHLDTWEKMEITDFLAEHITKVSNFRQKGWAGSLELMRVDCEVSIS